LINRKPKGDISGRTFHRDGPSCAAFHVGRDLSNRNVEEIIVYSADNAFDGGGGSTVHPNRHHGQWRTQVFRQVKLISILVSSMLSLSLLKDSRLRSKPSFHLFLRSRKFRIWGFNSKLKFAKRIYILFCKIIRKF